MKAIIFDFDGLLADTEIISFKVYQKLLSDYGFSFSKEEYAKHYSGKTEAANVARLIDTYHLPWTQQEGFNQVVEIEKRFIAEGVELKQGANQLLTYLKNKGLKAALATSSTKDRAMDILQKHEIHQFFDAFVFSEDVQRSKPDPEVFLKACEKLGVAHDEAIVLEDSENGILAAWQAQIPVICIPDMKKPAQSFLDKTLAAANTLEDVIDYLENTWIE